MRGLLGFNCGRLPLRSTRAFLVILPPAVQSASDRPFALLAEANAMPLCRSPPSDAHRALRAWRRSRPSPWRARSRSASSPADAAPRFAPFAPKLRLVRRDRRIDLRPRLRRDQFRIGWWRGWCRRRIEQLRGLRVDRRGVPEAVEGGSLRDANPLFYGPRQSPFAPNLESIYRSARRSSHVSLSFGSFSTTAVSSPGSPRTYRRTSTVIGNISSTCRPRNRASASGL